MAAQGLGRRVVENNHNVRVDIQLVRLFVCTLLWIFLSINPAHATTYIAGDLAPRGTPNGSLNAGDLVVMQRLAFGLITPPNIPMNCWSAMLPRWVRRMEF